MQRTVLLSIERSLIGIGSGAASLMLYVALIGVIANWPLSDNDQKLLVHLGPWLMSLYCGVLGGILVGLPVGLLCGYCCGKLPPYYSTSAMAAITLPWLVSSPDNPTIYIPAFIVSCAHFAGAVLGAKWRLRNGTSPTFEFLGAKNTSAQDIIFLDFFLLLSFISAILLSHTLLESMPRYNPRVSAALLISTASTLWLWYSRSRKILRAHAGEA